MTAARGGRSEIHTWQVAKAQDRQSINAVV